jgi:hypothetical protein
MDKKISNINRVQKDFRTELYTLEDRTMDVEMSVRGAHMCQGRLSSHQY